ncbi:MAG: UvrD-helicase domain-containing protein [Planctomycetes bacterium]|nr:UvrD-helicase domain-containing protein [Planctomycetota bacterium]
MSAGFSVATDAVDPGVLLIEAGAGTGKTWTIANLVVRAVVQGWIEHPGQALVVTFTEAATAELAERVRRFLAQAAAALAAEAEDPLAANSPRCAGAATSSQGPVAPSAPPLRCGPEGPPPPSSLRLLYAAMAAGVPRAEARRRVDEALLQADLLAVRTIHGFCKQTLEQAAFEARLPFETELLTDDGPLIEGVILDRWRSVLAEDPWLAAAASQGGWTPAADQQVWRAWDRHPGTRFLPDLALDQARAALAAAAAGLVLDPPARAGLLRAWAAVGWTKPGVEAGLDRAERVEALVDGCASPAGALAAAALFADPTPLARKRSKDEKAALAALLAQPWIQACAQVATAAAALLPAWRRELCAGMGAELERRKRDQHWLTQDDLLRRLDAALADPAGAALVQVLRSRHRLVLIDEFQDTDPVQWRIFRGVFATPAHRLVLVGDPKQAIYGFRGGDVATYLAAAASAGQRADLLCNQRSEPALVQAVNALFARRPQPFLDPAPAFTPAVGSAEGARRRLRCGGADWDQARVWWLDAPDAVGAVPGLVAERLGELLAADLALQDGDAPARPLGAGDCAVLVRTNRQGRAVQAALLTAGIPAVIADSGDVLASDEAQELAALLGATLEPRRAGLVRAALATRLWGWDAARLAALDRGDVAAMAAWDAVLARLERWRDALAGQGVLAWWERVQEDTGAALRLAALALGERRLTDCRHLVELLHLRRCGGAALDDLAAWLAGATDGEDDSDERRLRLDRDAAAVQVVTAHRSKGLQYPVVFCPYLWTPVRPPAGGWCLADLDRERALVHGGPRQDQAEAERFHADLAEDLRLAYVALTRARHLAVLVWGALGGTHGHDWRRSGLAWLLRGSTWELPPAAWVEAMRGSITALDGAARSTLDPIQWRDDALKVLAGHGLWPASLPARTAATAPVADPLPPWEAPRPPPARLVTSFTALTRSAHGRDQGDDRTAAPRVEEELLEGPALRGFARGPAAGVCLHELIEGWDFQVPADPAAVRAVLARHCLDQPAAHGGIDPLPVAQGLLAALAASRVAGPRGEPAVASLAQRSPGREWRFVLPLQRLTGAALAAVFRAHGQDDLAGRLEGLDGARLAGLLTGVVDWAVEDEDGRWWIVDWKSNRVAAPPGTARDQALDRILLDEHYRLQAHLYLLALHRQLRLRLPGYDPARHLGGWSYVFLRAIEPGSSAGWRSGSADPALVADLDALLAPAQAGGAQP